MEVEVYYRYYYGRQSVFGAYVKWKNQQTKKRAGKEWAREYDKLSNKTNKAIKWLKEPEFKKGIKYYFKKKAADKYEKTLLKVHSEVLDPNKIRRKKINAYRKITRKKEFLYNSETKKKMGKIVYEDKNQIGIKI